MMFPCVDLNLKKHFTHKDFLANFILKELLRKIICVVKLKRKIIEMAKKENKKNSGEINSQKCDCVEEF